VWHSWRGCLGCWWCGVAAWLPSWVPWPLLVVLWVWLLGWGPWRRRQQLRLRGLHQLVSH
jgi:hypothetical protein